MPGLSAVATSQFATGLNPGGSTGEEITPVAPQPSSFSGDSLDLVLLHQSNASVESILDAAIARYFGGPVYDQDGEGAYLDNLARALNAFSKRGSTGEGDDAGLDLQAAAAGDPSTEGALSILDRLSRSGFGVSTTTSSGSASSGTTSADSESSTSEVDESGESNSDGSTTGASESDETAGTEGTSGDDTTTSGETDDSGSSDNGSSDEGSTGSGDDGDSGSGGLIDLLF